MNKFSLIALLLLIILTSCEEVIEVGLNSSDPAFVVEAVIYKDSVTLVRLTTTTSYYSVGEPEFITDASIKISDGISNEELIYKGNGYYSGSSIHGVEGRNYVIEILHDGILYKSISSMPFKTDIVSVGYSRNNTQTIYNPSGKTMFVIRCEFIDDPEADNYYMIRYILDGKVLTGSYYLLTEQTAVNGSLDIFSVNRADQDTIRFEEWMFYEGGMGEVQVFSIDKSVYDYFVQLNDVLFWKRRYNPPATYNPVSNINNGALGYFAAWTFDSQKLILE
jgi:hypothetical protein